ncbi:hypothetical protein BDF14DRAFT_1745642 [Spinellus fusiger]|nr:hypothetical protein BDF14DRAFT_1745642 [Spinellus fusiger]
MPTSTAISPNPLSSVNKSIYGPIPLIPACLGGQWKNVVKTPYLKATMRFTTGTTLPQHHFPAVIRMEVLYGSIRVNDYQNGEAFLLTSGQDCMIPAMLVHELQCLEDVEIEFCMNYHEWVIFWDLEER